LNKFFFIFYSIFISLIYVIATPFLFYLSKKRQKYKNSIPARFFLKDNPPFKPNGVWFHSCSFGEVRGIYPILDKLPKELLRLSTTTQTGYEASKQKVPNQSRYLPFEPLLFFWMTPQKVLVVMEAEFWYLLFALAKKRGAKTILINARMSDRSFHKYKRISWFYKMIFFYIDEVYAQSEIDKKRLEILGAKNIQVIGNIKLANIPKNTKKLSKPKALLICGASTHEGEEELILNAFLNLKKKDSSVKLVIVPRHPERFDKVCEIVNKFSLYNHYHWHRYSQNEAFNSDIIVVDVLGELINIYAISDIVILGGAFEPHGGHNAVEVAQFGCKIISGVHYFNQRDIFNMIDGIKIVKKEDLSIALEKHNLIKSSKIRKKTDIKPILETIKREL